MTRESGCLTEQGERYVEASYPAYPDPTVHATGRRAAIARRGKAGGPRLWGGRRYRDGNRVMNVHEEV